MNRRSFLTRWGRAAGETAPPSFARPSAAGLEPYTPSASQPWDALRAGHLLRRALFLPTWSDITTILGSSPSAAVDLLLSTPSTPTVPTCANSETESLEGLDQTYKDMVRRQWGNDIGVLRLWQANTLKGQGLSIAEKMTAFWSNHFATEFVAEEDVVVAPLLYRQNKLFRETGLGNFRDLVFNVTLDGAMLVYLGGILNVAGKPNENYARELLELFTTGLGHYTEGDIKEAARVLTGWQVGQFSDKPALNGMFEPYFVPALHDTGGKQFLGESFAARDVSTNTEFLVRRDEVRKLTDTIFARRGEAVAEFICRKLYRFFVYSNPTGNDNGVISAMADLFIQSGFEIRPVVAALLKSAHFFDNANIGAQIKTPLEFEIGVARQLGGTRDMASDAALMGQELFDPPNVGGWPGYHDWITTTTYPIRADVAQNVISGLSESDLLAFMQRFPDHTDAADLVRDVAALLLPRPLSTDRRKTLLDKLLNGAPDYEWPTIVSSSPSTAARNLREMLLVIAILPDFQLC